eukprot:Hpha_TRINITY_DN16076_c1_g2::TRINITY_DN16076_c1_g2_i2::g.119111::m.119111
MVVKETSSASRLVDLVVLLPPHFHRLPPRVVSSEVCVISFPSWWLCHSFSLALYGRLAQRSNAQNTCNTLLYLASLPTYPPSSSFSDPLPSSCLESAGSPRILQL